MPIKKFRPVTPGRRFRSVSTYAEVTRREPEIIEKWERLGVYGLLRQDRRGREKFVLHDGPPYANGHIHMGHALNKILKDIVVKSRSLEGCDAPYVPGWDCHGLPIELQVDRTLGRKKAEMSISRFRQECRQYDASQECQGEPQ